MKPGKAAEGGRSVVYAVPVVLPILRERLARLLLEEAHEMAGIGEAEHVGQLVDIAPGEEPFALERGQKALLQQMGRRNAELRLDRAVERRAADAHPVGILAHALHLADVPLEELLEEESMVVPRDIEGQRIAGGISPVEQHQQIGEKGDDEVVAVGHGVQQFGLHAGQKGAIVGELGLGKGEAGRSVGLVAIEQAVSEKLVGHEGLQEIVAENEEIVV